MATSTSTSSLVRSLSCLPAAQPCQDRGSVRRPSYAPFVVSILVVVVLLLLGTVCGVLACGASSCTCTTRLMAIMTTSIVAKIANAISNISSSTASILLHPRVGHQHCDPRQCARSNHRDGWCGWSRRRR